MVWYLGEHDGTKAWFWTEVGPGGIRNGIVACDQHGWVEGCDKMPLPACGAPSDMLFHDQGRFWRPHLSITWERAATPPPPVAVAGLYA